MFRCLGLANVEQLPSLDDILDVWTMLRSDNPPDVLRDEVTALQSIFISLNGSTGEKWQSFFVKEPAPNLLKVVQHVLSVPVSNASVEQIFSVTLLLIQQLTTD